MLDLSFSIPDLQGIARIAARLLCALIIGAVIGLQRELAHKPAGLRTHMLVALGSSLLVIATVEARMTSSDVARVIEGLVTGIGFLGGGAILKLTAEQEIHGLTTAASIWMTAAVGVVVGLGQIVTAALALALGLIILAVLSPLERRLSRRPPAGAENRGPPGSA